MSMIKATRHKNWEMEKSLAGDGSERKGSAKTIRTMSTSVPDNVRNHLAYAKASEPGYDIGLTAHKVSWHCLSNFNGPETISFEEILHEREMRPQIT
jgi:hypothetical protein